MRRRPENVIRLEPVRRARRRGTRRARPLWTKVCLLAAVAALAIGGREGILSLDASDWLPSFGTGQPIRAAMAVAPVRPPGDAAGRTDCSVRRVIDGDTVDLDCPGAGLLRARLLGFDTPEVSSPGCAAELSLGSAATLALARRISASGEMRVDLRGSDHYGRRLARLSLDGRDVAGPMIAEGLARPYDGGRRRSWCG